MHRINIVGTSGSGKTTVGRGAIEALGCPHVELDALHWEPGWQEVPNEVFRERVSDATRGESWIVDGNYSKARDIVWGRADTVVWLDYSFSLIFLRVLWRTLRRIVTREPLWNGNRESLAMALSRDSIILWVINTYARRKKEFPELMADPKFNHIRFLRHKNPRETEDWIMFLSESD